MDEIASSETDAGKQSPAQELAQLARASRRRGCHEQREHDAQHHLDRLVERSADAADRRVIHLRLTPDGRRMAKRLVDTRRGHLERAVAHWPAEKRLLFADMINELVDALMGTDVDSPR